MLASISACVTKGLLLHDRFCLTRRLGKGGFGQVFKANDTKYNNEIALKVEPIYSCLTLRNERKIYEKLWKKEVPIGIPHPIAYHENNGMATLAMPVLGQSLRDVWKQNGGFSMRSIAYIGVQMLNRLEFIHRHGIVHLDIKPENMILGRGMDSKTVYLIDFGLSTSFRDKSGEHVPVDEYVRFCGTPAFSSMHRDACQQVSPRDDLESLMYSLVMLYDNHLPWCWGDWARSSNYSHSIEDDKIDCRKSVCSGTPPPFQKAWRMVRKMQHAVKPKYDRLRALFLEAASGCRENDGLKFNLR